MISFTVDGSHPHDIATIVDKEGVAIRAGQHCTQPLLDFFNLSSTARASIGMYTNKNDIDFFNQNAESVWKYILENQFLFSSESILKQHFITPAHTTQLGTPGRFGVWLGWQILRLSLIHI